jgi:hypothetical protein
LVTPLRGQGVTKIGKTIDLREAAYSRQD